VTDSAAALRTAFLGYIDCLNTQAWQRLGEFVDDEVRYNGRPVGLRSYREQRQAEFENIPDLHFAVDLLACDPPHVAARLKFDCTPRGTFLGLPVGGRRVQFTENASYAFHQGRIAAVWSLIDREAVKRQLPQ
jgi:predicted ester cyclase